MTRHFIEYPFRSCINWVSSLFLVSFFRRNRLEVSQPMTMEKKSQPTKETKTYIGIY
jgi:hypothetical protein